MLVEEVLRIMPEEKQQGAGATVATTPSTSTTIESLAKVFGAKTNAAIVYGERVEHDGVTVIPVAKVVYGFGCGLNHSKVDTGEGGGGGARVTPIGYIEIKCGRSRFRRILDVESLTRPIIVGGLLGLLALRSILRSRDCRQH
jgi:uncharacterized spore protein YtfJ